VPPTHGRVPALLDDLAVFMNRTDLPALPQAMITHAQFETIHPFTDGNGRTGRALIHTVVRRRGLARSVAVPTSAALLADTDAYFESLGAYRAGDLDGFIAHVASAALRAACEAHVLASELEQIRGRWTDAVSPKPGSVAAAILDLLRRQPVLITASLRLGPRRNRALCWPGRFAEQASFVGLFAQLFRRLDTASMPAGLTRPRWAAWRRPSRAR
jgi:hypothetical protein